MRPWRSFPAAGRRSKPVHGLFKTELIRRRGPWRSMDAVEFATLEWVDWFNNRRILQPIGNMPPAEAEERYFAQQERSGGVTRIPPKDAGRGR